MQPLLLLVVLLLTPAIAWAAPFDITGPSGSDIDTDPNSPTVLSFTVTETGSIETLSLRLNIDEEEEGLTYWDNLFVSLSHNGIDVTIFDFQTDLTGSDDSLDATFTDGEAALTNAIESAPTTGTFAPLEALSAFTGQELSGEWTLTFYDNFDGDDVSDDGTDLLSSSIFGTTSDPAVPPTPVPAMPLWALILLVPLLGFIARRRLASRRG